MKKPHNARNFILADASNVILLLCGAGAHATRATRRRSTRSLAADNICNNISIYNKNTRTYSIIDILNNIKFNVGSKPLDVAQECYGDDNDEQCKSGTAKTGRSALINVNLLYLSKQH